MTIFCTSGLPFVSVPVLSKTIIEISLVLSKLSPVLNSMPFFDPRPVPTIIAVGVASPKAQGQAITNTATALIIADAKSRLTKYQPKKVKKAMKIITGTKIPEILVNSSENQTDDIPF